jgi:hypothetical protein
LSPGDDGNVAAVEIEQRVGEWLRAAFGEAVRQARGEPTYFVALGRVGVRVDIVPVGGGDSVVEAYSWIGQGIPITDELGRHLAERNAELNFGTLSIDGEGAIILGHSLFGDGASETVLTRLVRILAETAEVLDGELQRR